MSPIDRAGLWTRARQTVAVQGRLGQWARAVAFAGSMTLIAACGSERPALTTEAIEVASPATPIAGLLDPEAQPAPATTAPLGTVEAAVPPTATARPAATPTVPRLEVARLGLEVIETLPHDPNAWTQGLQLDGEGHILETTGAQVAESVLRRVEPATGEIVQEVTLPGGWYGEGMTQVGDQLVQVTWRDERAIFWDAETFELLREVPYRGEGWGLCLDDDRLVMTDGTANLAFRDPQSFIETAPRQEVTLNGAPLAGLNELECVDGKVWANVWRTDLLVRIDPDRGIVDAIVDATELGQPRAPDVNVMNGVAWDASTDTFLITGKLWPELYRVRFVEP